MKIEIEASELYKVLGATNVYRDEAILQFKEDGIMLRVQDESATAVYNTLIPDTAMETYQRGEFPKLGIHVDDMYDFTPNKEVQMTVELDTNTSNKFVMQAGTREFRVPAIDPEHVEGQPEMVPNLSLPIKVELEPDPLLEFISDVYSRIYNQTSDAHFYLQANEGVLSLWGKRDDYELYEWWHWEDFENYDINWDQASAQDNHPGNPAQDQQAVCILSSGLTKDMVFFTDTARMEFGHGKPFKMVSETDNGVKHSWIVPPRFPRDDQPDEIPERIIKKRAVVS